MEVWSRHRGVSVQTREAEWAAGSRRLGPGVRAPSMRKAWGAGLSALGHTPAESQQTGAGHPTWPGATPRRAPRGPEEWGAAAGSAWAGCARAALARPAVLGQRLPATPSQRLP